MYQTILIMSKMDEQSCARAFVTFNHIKNRCSTKTITDAMTPVKFVYGKKLASHLKRLDIKHETKYNSTRETSLVPVQKQQ